MRRFRSPLLWTFVTAVALLIAVGGWLLTDPLTSRSDALKTGGLAGSAVVALYALWLNDRRRKVEERRQEVERQRHELELQRSDADRTRVADERFAKAVELLGNDADQVRVGALHALAGLARNREEYRQTVLDVLCSYLRRPFHHPRYDLNEPDRRKREEKAGTPEQERELQVRLTAQRLITELLPPADDATGISYNLDLTGAVTEYLDFSGRTIGELLLRYASLHSSTNFSGCRFTGDVYLTAAGTGSGRLIGDFRCREAIFEKHAWFSGTRFGRLADFTGTTFEGETSFKDAEFGGAAVFAEAVITGSLDLRRARFDDRTDLRFAEMPKNVSLHNTLARPTKDVQLRDEWTLEQLSGGDSRIVPAGPM
ncbi:MAG TPA: pentapeptide repeat-containing protein [Amycolatopsis sp.]|nr:pentapeptide repeat-containing protein [Amycolatopsis sp.]